MPARFTRFALSVVALAALVGGCDDDLPKATEIERMRLLGAKVTVTADPDRATPEPGEDVDVELVSVFPTLEGAVADAQSMVITCTQPTRYTGGIPVCQEFLEAALGGAVDLDAVLDIAQKLRCIDLGGGVFEQMGISLRCIDGDPRFSFRVPSGFAADQVLYRGVVCERGQAYVDPFDPLFFGCDDNDGETFRIHGTVTVQQEAEDANDNPSFANAELLIGNPGEEGGRAWTPLDPADFPAEDDCWDDADAVGMLRADSFGNHQITIRWDPDARDEVDGMPEDVELSLFATTGEMEQRFVLFDERDEPEDGMLVDTVTWTPPTELETRSQIVRFFFTVLDRRGGFDWTSRALCLR